MWMPIYKHSGFEIESMKKKIQTLFVGTMEKKKHIYGNIHRVWINVSRKKNVYVKFMY